MRIIDVGRAFPRHFYEQETLLGALKAHWGQRHRNPARLRDQDPPTAVVREPDRERGRDHGGLARARGRLDDGRPARVQCRLEVGQGGGERQPGTEAVEGGGEDGRDGDGTGGGGHRVHCARAAESAGG